MLLPLAAPRAARAETVKRDVTVDGVTYELKLDAETKTASVSGITDPAEPRAISIPGTVEVDGETYTVTSLSWIYSSSEKVPNVTSVTLPDTLTDAGANFRIFTNVTEITIPGSVKVFDGKFQYMDKLERVVFAEGVEEIGAAANSMFSNDPNLVEISLPSTLRVINASSMFSGATALTSVTFPEGVTFGEDVIGLFQGCTSLESVALPASIDEIPYATFQDCTSLVSVSAEGTITAIGGQAFYRCSSLQHVPDLSQVTSIGASAFQRCDSIVDELDLSSLTEIPTGAFWAEGAKIVALSPDLRTIGQSGLRGTNISAVTLPERLQSIGAYGLEGVTTGETLVIPDSVTELGDGALRFITTAKSVYVGSGVTQVSTGMFPTVNVETITFNNSPDDVTIEGTFLDRIQIIYTQPSLPDTDAVVSDGGPTLQEAVNASSPGDVITLEKNVTLADTLVIPAGKDVTISTDGTARTIFATRSGGVDALVRVEAGASVTFAGEGDGALTLLGRYNKGPVVESAGAMTLATGSEVTRATVAADESGALVASGEGAELAVAGGRVHDCLVASGVALSGTVRVSDGARFSMTGGAIENNDARAAHNQRSTSGVLLDGHATGEMSGGTISGNRAHRGAALLLYGFDDAHRTSFELSGGTISDNECASVLGNEDSGAVHVDNNAELHMTGGSISNNRGEQGAGVCVVDWALQANQPESRTAFVMDGGVISGNEGKNGGGIYSYSNGVELRAGEISGNTASNLGGGVYSEGNNKYYSTLYLENALVSGNTAAQGGGMWFCATGSTTVNVTRGIAVFDNVARESSASEAAGDDFVFAGNHGEGWSATLADRMLGGGWVSWMRDGSVYLPMGGTFYPSVGNAPRYGEEGADETPVSAQGVTEGLALKAVPAEGATEVARDEATLVITGNAARFGGGIASNGGIVAGEQETTSVHVAKVWDDEDDKDGLRPDAVTVRLLRNGAEIDSAVLSEENGWEATFEGLPADGEYTVSEDVPEGYEVTVDGSVAEGFTLTNTHVPGEEPGEPEEPNTPDTPEEPDIPEEPDGPAPEEGELRDEIPATGEHASPAAVVAVTGAGALAAGGIWSRARRARG